MGRSFGKFAFAVAFGTLFSLGTARAQNECAAVNPGYEPVQQTLDGSGVLHQITCQDPLTGKMYATSWFFANGGSIQPPPTSIAFSGLTTGNNTQAAMGVGTGASLLPLNFGRISPSLGETFFSTDPQPTAGIPSWTSTNTGGALQNNHHFSVQYTLVGPLGETTPNKILNQTPGFFDSVCVNPSTACTIIIAAPVIPAGYTGYTIYTGDATNSQTPQQYAPCANITGNCTITGPIPNTVAPPTTNPYVPQPSLTKASACPTNVTPIAWVPDANGNLNTEQYISQYSNSGGGPTSASVAGIRTFCRPVWFTDAQVDPLIGKNAFVAMYHNFGGPTDIFNTTANQDRILHLQGATPAADTSSHWGIEGIQTEIDTTFASGGGITGSPDGESAAASFQNVDNSTANWATGALGAYSIRANMAYNGAGKPASGTIPTGVINAFFQVNNTANWVSGTHAAVISAGCTNGAGGTISGFECDGFVDGIMADSGKPGNGQKVIWARNTGGVTFTPTAGKDFFLANDFPNFDSWLNGRVTITGFDFNAVGTMTSNANLSLLGTFQTTQQPSNWNPGVTGTCTGGASTYTYKLVAVDALGGVSASTSFNSPATCANPLTVGNPFSWSVNGAFGVKAQSAARIDVYRTGGPMATGKVGSYTCNTQQLFINCNVQTGSNAFVDSGLAADGGTPAAANTTGEQASAGYLAANGNKFFVTSNFTTAANANLQAITGLAFNLDPNAKNYQFTCNLAYSQGTAAAAVAFGIQSVTVAPSNIFATGEQFTAATTATQGVLPTLTTTTATNIVSATPGATATNFIVQLAGTIEEPANDAGNVVQIMVSTATAADAVTILRGSYCYLY